MTNPLIDLAELNSIAQRAMDGDFHLFISVYRTTSGNETVRVTLEKGSTYGKFHMKVEGTGETVSGAFEAALRQFPQNPLDGVARWDSARLAAPAPVEDGDFTEIN